MRMLLALMILSSTTLAADVQHVIVVSVDGLHPSALRRAHASKLPTFARLREGSAYTHNARNDFYSSVTIPNHISMLTGRPSAGKNGHGVSINFDNRRYIARHRGNYVPGMFDVAHDNGLRTGFYASKGKFRFIRRSWDAKRGKQALLGREKIDQHLITLNTTKLMDRFFDDNRSRPQNLSFIHLIDADIAGHDFGWLSKRYFTALGKVDRLLARLLDFVENEEAFRDRTAIILTSDHGGLGHGHRGLTSRQVYKIPFYVWGGGAEAGSDLYTLNRFVRSRPGKKRPAKARAAIRNGEAANLALSLLHLQAVPGSTLNRHQDLVIRSPRGGPDETGRMARIVSRPAQAAQKMK